MIKLVRVLPENRELLWNLHQKYLHEMTKYYDNEMDENGNYHYGYFDAYFIQPERKAYFIYSDDRLAGFAMINPYSYIGAKPDHVLAEFTVFPAFRRRGIGMQAAQCILEVFPGSWEIKYNVKNTGAKCLWEGLTAQYSPVSYAYSENETVLAFSTEQQS